MDPHDPWGAGLAVPLSVAIGFFVIEGFNVARARWRVWRAKRRIIKGDGPWG